MLNGKIYEVIVMSELELNAHNTKKPREEFLEGILNEYAENGYRIAGVYKDVIFMENFDTKMIAKQQKAAHKQELAEQRLKDDN